MHALWNLFAFHVGWFACVLGGAHHVPWLGIVVVATLLVLHTNMAVRPGEELKLIAIAALIGFVWESVLVSVGWLAYPSGTLLAGTAPLWVAAMWANFATTLNVSLRWLRGHRLVAVLLGGIIGPFTYYISANHGGVVLAEPAAAFASLALAWAILLPVLTALATRFYGFEPDGLTQGVVPVRS